MIRFQNRWSPRLTKRLGKIAILFGQIEYLFKLYVKQFLGHFNRGMIVTSRIQLNQLLELTTALVKHDIKDEALRQSYFDIIARLESAERRRNDYIHSAWGMDANGDAVNLSYVRTRTNQQRAGTGLVKNRTVVSEPALDDLIGELMSIKDDLRQLRVTIWPSLRKVPVKVRARRRRRKK